MIPSHNDNPVQFCRSDWRWGNPKQDMRRHMMIARTLWASDNTHTVLKLEANQLDTGIKKQQSKQQRSKYLPTCWNREFFLFGLHFCFRSMNENGFLHSWRSNKTFQSFINRLGYKGGDLGSLHCHKMRLYSGGCNLADFANDFLAIGGINWTSPSDRGLTGLSQPFPVTAEHSPISIVSAYREDTLKITPRSGSS